MREYDEIVVDTLEDADLFLPGMTVLMGDDDAEWTVESIDANHWKKIKITVYRDTEGS